MTATDELRRMLTDAGVEWDYGITGAASTRFNANGVELTFVGMRDGVTCSTILTPEQAIAATLGRGTCRLKPWEMERDTGYYDCMQCGCGYVADVGDWAEWHFCPICGAKVVDE
jgi:membrane protease subunit (stomatin/prohibitin family)